MKQPELITLPLIHRGFAVNRTKKADLNKTQGYDHGALERAFMELWEEENKPRPGINHGGGILSDLVHGSYLRGGVPKWLDPEITQRDAHIVAEVIQWLGTNCGLCFLQQAFKRAGMRMSYERTSAEQKRWQRNYRERQRRARKAVERLRVKQERPRIRYFSKE